MSDPHSELAELLALASSPTEVRAALDTLFSPAEVDRAEKRVAILRSLEAGLSQRQAATALGVSPTTVARGGKALKEAAGRDQKTTLLALLAAKHIDVEMPETSIEDRAEPPAQAQGSQE